MSRAQSRERVLRLSSILIGAASLAAAGCGSSPPAKQTATAAVTPETGGTVALPDDSAKLDVPMGAVSTTTMITMTTTDATAPVGITADSPILQFAPDGTVFTKPVTVTFTFKNATSPVVYWSNSSGGYDLIEGTVTGSTIAAPVMHFSKGFVGERPAGSTATCADGVACTAGMTCGFGGTTNGGATNAGSTSGGSTNTGSGASKDGGISNGGGGAADASATTPPAGTSDPGSKPGASSALSSSDPGGATLCCSCGSDGVFHCSTCADSTVKTCAQGASCQPGGSNGGDPATGTGGSHDAGAGGTTTTPPGGGVSAAPDGGMSFVPDGGAGQPPAQCVEGGACQPGGAGCDDASPDSCTMCVCGANGILECAPCPGAPDGGTVAPPPPPDAGATDPQTCLPGLQCSGATECNYASPQGCMTCACANGVYKCGSCGGAADASAPPPQVECGPGLDCPTPGMMCGVPSSTSCQKCTCGDSHSFTCVAC